MLPMLPAEFSDIENRVLVELDSIMSGLDYVWSDAPPKMVRPYMSLHIIGHFFRAVFGYDYTVLIQFEGA